MKQNRKIDFAAAKSILGVLDVCDDYPFDELGLDDEIVKKLIELDSTGQRFITDRAPSWLSIKCDKSELRKSLLDFEEEKALRELEDEYLLNNAPSRSMRELFGMHPSDFCKRRKGLGMSGQGRHRPIYCDEKTETIIWEHWKATKYLDPRERYLEVAKRSKQSLNIVFTAINRYNDKPSK